MSQKHIKRYPRALLVLVDVFRIFHFHQLFRHMTEGVSDNIIHSISCQVQLGCLKPLHVKVNGRMKYFSWKICHFHMLEGC